MSNPIGWFEIYVNDMQRAKAFYEGVLGVALTRLDSPDPGSAVEMWAFPMDSNVYGASGTLASLGDQGLAVQRPAVRHRGQYDRPAFHAVAGFWALSTSRSCPSLF